MIPPDLAARLNAIHAQMSRGDIAGAWQAITPILAGNPAIPAVAQLGAMVRRADGDLAGARDLLTAAIARGAASPELHNLLGNLLGDLGDAQGADLAYANAADSNPAYPDPWINRGQLAARTGAHDAAVNYLRHACTLAPRSVLARVSLGNALRLGGAHEAAMAALREAIDIDPARATTWLHLGVAQTAAGDPASALQSYDEAARRGLDTPELADNRAAALIALDRLQDALAQYDRIVARFPGYIAGHQSRARLIWEYGLGGDAFASYAALARQYPRERGIWEAWANNLNGFRRFMEAAEIAAQGLVAAGDSPALRLTRAIALSEAGGLDEAGALFEGLKDVLGNLPDLHIAHARHLLRARDPMGAASAAQAVLARSADNQLGWAYLGTAWRMLDDPRETWLHDYDAHVAQIEAIPPGWSDPPQAFVETTAAALRRLHVTQNHPADQTLRNGTQTAGALFHRREPEIAALKVAVETAVERYISALPDDPAHPMLRRKRTGFRFTGSWSVRLRRQGYHINHVHPEGWISSAFYFALPDPDPADPPYAGALQLGSPPDEMGLGLPPRRIVTPRPGSLILFPSSMWHGTLPFAGDSERLTMAFDAVPAG